MLIARKRVGRVFFSSSCFCCCCCCCCVKKQASNIYVGRRHVKWVRNIWLADLSVVLTFVFRFFFLAACWMDVACARQNIYAHSTALHITRSHDGLLVFFIFIFYFIVFFSRKLVSIGEFVVEQHTGAGKKEKRTWDRPIVFSFFVTMC